MEDDGPLSLSALRRHHHQRDQQQFLVESPWSRTTTVIKWDATSTKETSSSLYSDFLCHVVASCSDFTDRNNTTFNTTSRKQKQELCKSAYLVREGKVVDPEDLFRGTNIDSLLYLRFRIRGGMDRQNRVGSKFGGGGQSSQQQSERERKERLKKLALESIDIAKDPYLVRNHLGSYECKLCLTLHRDEANYLAHTQGKKHQQGLARRAYEEKLKAEREGQTVQPTVSTTAAQPTAVRKIRIGRPAYQVFKSRDPDTNQRCLSFELQYPEIDQDLQPRHRFMSAFEQRVESPPNRNYQYLIFAADPYENVAFKIPNEPIDKGDDRFVTHWDSDSKTFTVTLYFVDSVQ